MLAFLFGVLLLTAPADTTDQKDRCVEIHRGAYVIEPVVGKTPPEQWQWFIGEIRKARTCYARFNPDFP